MLGNLGLSHAMYEEGVLCEFKLCDGAWKGFAML